MFKKLAKQLKATGSETSCFPMSSPVESLKDETRNSFLKSMSKHALSLYERQTDINTFTKLALSDPENESHNDIVSKLFAKGNIIDPFEKNSLSDLTENDNFLKDLGL